jgi:hypothetical protein
MAVDRFHQRRHVFWRGELADAMAEVEDVPGHAAVGIARRAEAVQRGTRFGLHDLRRREQDHWVEVALQRDAIAHAPAGGTQVGRPVEADDVRADVGDRLQPLAAALREDDGRDALAYTRCV